MTEIKHNITGAVLYRSETAETVRQVVLEAVKARADLRGADLRGADLSGADLRGADLRGADLDYSSGIPLSCKGSRFTCSAQLVRQIFAHISTLTVIDADDELEAALAAILPEAKKSHRALDLRLTQ